MTQPVTARARIRAELTDEILQVAGRQLAEHGAAALSLRAVAREVGLVSSAVYRYFPSRDELLTALIVAAYRSVGQAGEQAVAAVRRSDRLGQWLALTRAVRSWAVANPQQYALIFGSPVPGYRAPADTIDPAARIPLLIVGILDANAAAGGLSTGANARPMPRVVRADLKALQALLGSALTEAQMGRAVLAWTELIGSISFELFGHLNNVIHDYETYFDYQMTGVGHQLGLG